MRKTRVFLRRGLIRRTRLDPQYRLLRWKGFLIRDGYVGFLPNEMLLEIASHLMLRDVLNLSLVNKGFHAIAMHDTVWKMLFAQFKWNNMLSRNPSWCAKEHFIRCYRGDIVSVRERLTISTHYEIVVIEKRKSELLADKRRELLCCRCTCAWCFPVSVKAFHIIAPVMPFGSMLDCTVGKFIYVLVVDLLIASLLNFVGAASLCPLYTSGYFLLILAWITICSVRTHLCEKKQICISYDSLIQKENIHLKQLNAYKSPADYFN